MSAPALTVTRGTVRPRPGTRAGAFIERTILGRIERAIPAAAPLIRRIQNCGGCKTDIARLDGDGGGSTV